MGWRWDHTEQVNYLILVLNRTETGVWGMNLVSFFSPSVLGYGINWMPAVMKIRMINPPVKKEKKKP